MAAVSELIHQQTLQGPSVPSQCITVTVPTRDKLGIKDIAILTCDARRALT